MKSSLQDLSECADSYSYICLCLIKLRLTQKNGERFIRIFALIVDSKSVSLNLGGKCFGEMDDAVAGANVLMNKRGKGEREPHI